MTTPTRKEKKRWARRLHRAANSTNVYRNAYEPALRGSRHGVRARAWIEAWDEHGDRRKILAPWKPWRGEKQPLDLIRGGDPITAEVMRDGRIDGALLLRHLVPSLSEARAQELARLLPDTHPTTSALRAFIDKYAPERV